MTSAPRHLVLVGLMGAGKTSVGTRCAERIGREFVDTDDVVERISGISVPEIFSTFGESRFRELEHQAVVDVCASPEPLVIACGGGTVVDADNRRRLAGAGYVVWLRAPVDVLAARCGDQERDRPLLAGDPLSALTRLLARREPAYEAVADVVVDTGERALDEVVDTVLDAFCGAAR